MSYRISTSAAVSHLCGAKNQSSVELQEKSGIVVQLRFENRTGLLSTQYHPHINLFREWYNKPASNFANMSEPTLNKLPATAPIDEILDVLSRDGGLIITNLVSPDILSKVATELKPHEQQDQVWKGNFFPEATKRILGAVGKSPTLAKEIFMHPVFQEVCSRTLTMTKKSRYGDETRTFVCKPVANASTTFDIGPGAEAQQLHRDDGVHHLAHPCPTQMIGMLVAETRTTKENGATVVIPGSHKRVSNSSGCALKREVLTVTQ